MLAPEAHVQIVCCIMLKHLKKEEAYGFKGYADNIWSGVFGGVGG